MTTSRRGMLRGLLAGGVASMLPHSVMSAPRRLSTAALAKSVLLLAEKAAKARLTSEAKLLWELHRKLSLLPLSVEGGEDEEEEPPLKHRPRVAKDPLGLKS